MHRISISHIIGIFLIIAGIILILSADISVKRDVNKINTSSEIVQPEKDDKIKSISLAVKGGMCLIVSVPFFYMPYCEYNYSLFRRKRKKEEKENTEQAEKEFDYPDDDFDYIIDEKTRHILIEFRDEQRKKYDKKIKKTGEI